ncbi:uncharacterized protein LOC106157528 [Lingula anatina]|uniref:Uncharacterized protein LOC106157528 n=1 Tax=Lingula anatina TaxID=7574 RepID=A0A1S3HRK5_LINAN|nr:uncharacterized protein LOC106157528 [Lingula anatina]|eukprot:XP_013388663.1 uncharacterized protein LOC106157528 [Lingula anatina]
MLVIPLGAADTGQSGQCSDILVSGKYPIPDSAITASSYFNIDTWWYKHLPQQARIHLVSDDNGNGGWSAYSGGVQEWLQFDLEFPRLRLATGLARAPHPKERLALAFAVTETLAVVITYRLLCWTARPSVCLLNH